MTPSTRVNIQDTVKRIGEKETIREIFEVSELTSKLVKDSFGPAGLWNIAVDKTGFIHWAKSGSTILNRIEPKRSKLDEPRQIEKDPSKGKMIHPITRIMAGMAENIVQTVGDGSKTSIILTNEILRKKIESQIHSAIFIDGCINVMEKCLELIREISIPFSPSRPNTLNRIIRSFFDTRFEPLESRLLTDVVSRAVHSKIRKRTGGEYHLDSDSISIKREIGGGLLSTCLIDGVALFKEIPSSNMPKKVENVKVAITSGGLSSGFGSKDMKVRTRYYDHKMIFRKPDDIETFREEKTKVSKDIVDKLCSLKVGALLIEKGLDPEIEGILADMRIIAVRRIYIKDLEKIARATGANIVSDVRLLQPEDLGFAKLVKEKKIGDHPWILIKGRRSDEILTILIRGFVNAMIDEAENTIRNSLNVVEKFIHDPRILLGGGATEVEVANRLRRYAEGISRREQIVIKDLGEALETVPMILASSCGLDPIDSIVKLRTLHNVGRVFAGIDVFKRRIANMLTAGIYLPLPIYEQVIKSAFETSIHLLRINDFIASIKTYQGSEYWEKRVEEFTEPEREKQMIKEYGVDR